MFRLLPAGSGGAATAGRGNRSAARAWLTLRRVISSRPASVPSSCGGRGYPAGDQEPPPPGPAWRSLIVRIG